jgi:hypothetical protein
MAQRLRVFSRAGIYRRATISVTLTGALAGGKCVEANRVVFVSPHLDDAVLSAWHALTRSRRPIVVTCFAGLPPAGSQGYWDLAGQVADGRSAMEQRRVEDRRAIALVDGEAVHLDLVESQHRPDPGVSIDVVAELRVALRAVLHGAAEVWLPAGIGRHPDHVIARDTARDEAQGSAQLSYYADLPYAADPYWPRRLAGPVRRLTARPFRPDKGWERWGRHLALAGIGDALPRTRALRLSRSQLAAKWAAVSCYRSQHERLGLHSPASLAREAWWEC